MRIKRKVLSCKYEENHSPYSWVHFVITHFVNTFLIASSVAISSSLENPIVKPSQHDGAFSMVSSFRPGILLYIPGSSIELHHIYFQYLQ